MAITFDTETIRTITLFENLTNATVKDCLMDREANTVYFIIEEGKMGMAIGKNGSTIRNAEKIIGKHIKVFEFSKNLEIFVKNLIQKTEEIRIRREESKLIVEVRVEKKYKPMVIGRDGKKLKIFKEILQRNHNVDDLIIR